ncbi:hypothetical protein [Micromonospora sp. NPDC049891]|uniref:hypothetical protein n=1 Tax=Micromonospora sp. NPDC049891 TaxID=3155655 RepID=UPI0033ECA344
MVPPPGAQSINQQTGDPTISETPLTPSQARAATDLASQRLAMAFDSKQQAATTLRLTMADPKASNEDLAIATVRFQEAVDRYTDCQLALAMAQRVEAAAKRPARKSNR